MHLPYSLVWSLIYDTLLKLPHCIQALCAAFRVQRRTNFHGTNHLSCGKPSKQYSRKRINAALERYIKGNSDVKVVREEKTGLENGVCNRKRK